MVTNGGHDVRARDLAPTERRLAAERRHPHRPERALLRQQVLGVEHLRGPTLLAARSPPPLPLRPPRQCKRPPRPVQRRREWRKTSAARVRGVAGRAVFGWFRGESDESRETKSGTSGWLASRGRRTDGGNGGRSETARGRAVVTLYCPSIGDVGPEYLENLLRFLFLFLYLLVCFGYMLLQYGMNANGIDKKVSFTHFLSAVLTDCSTNVADVYRNDYLSRYFFSRM